jgi:hypothetical protein
MILDEEKSVPFPPRWPPHRIVFMDDGFAYRGTEQLGPWTRERPTSETELSPEAFEAAYIGDFCVRVDGVIRVASLLEMRAHAAWLDAKDVERYRREGCCGQRKPNGECGCRAVEIELRVERYSRGMSAMSLAAVGSLCPLSEWWIAYDLTRDAGAVREVRLSDFVLEEEENG